MSWIESGIKFDFPIDFSVEKFDETNFYKNSFTKLPDGKGVDFVAKNTNVFVMIEVKNCRGHENDNRWRIRPNNRKRTTTATTVNTEGRDSLDIELVQKVTMSLACLCGANSKPGFQSSDRLKPYFEMISNSLVSTGRNKIKVILFLEGDFSTKSHPQKKIMKDLQDSIKAKLSWLNCHVLVENYDTHFRDIYQASIV